EKRGQQFAKEGQADKEELETRKNTLKKIYPEESLGENGGKGKNLKEGLEKELEKKNGTGSE
ncbi:lysogenization regulator HflD, partial [Pasteurella multocida]|nr:lysogenization regulator HflD [Pasteurella multocida]